MSGPPRERGQSGFEAYYERLFGPRWPGLRAALVSPQRLPRVNRFAQPPTDRTTRVGPLAFLDTRVASEPSPLSIEVQPTPFYVMDPASVVAPLLLARELASRSTVEVLDLCAAPGGKSLVLAELLWRDDIEREAWLTLNERSRIRRARLHQVMKQYLPSGLWQRLRFTGHDAGRWGLHQPARYDAILLDAPCSSEQHVLADPHALSQWSSERIRHLARQQYAFLVSAATALKPGASLVYATCALTNDENDDVVQRLLDRKPDLARVDRDVDVADYAALGLEPTECGWRILPDTQGYGPLYFARLCRP